MSTGFLFTELLDVGQIRTDGATIRRVKSGCLPSRSRGQEAGRLSTTLGSTPQGQSIA